jgi:hypothetical protein
MIAASNAGAAASVEPGEMDENRSPDLLGQYAANDLDLAGYLRIGEARVWRGRTRKVGVD